jgi:hypothetical protein
MPNALHADETAPVEVVLPWRGGCLNRQTALEFLVARYSTAHPNWKVTVASEQNRAGAWIKARAVNPSIEASNAEVIVVADADVWTDGLGEAVQQIEAGAPWAVPHNLVHRLTEAGTKAVLNGDDWRDQPLAQRPYAGFIGGGVVVARREVFEAVPLDMRFKGWGQEDEAHGAALCALYGALWRGSADLIHLWHPPQARESRRKGSRASWALRQRYWKARTNPDQMLVLVEEGRESNAENAMHDPSPAGVG